MNKEFIIREAAVSDAKDGLCGFDYLKNKCPKMGHLFNGGDGGNRSFASFVATQPFAFICPFCYAKDGLCGFDYLKNKCPILGHLFNGGDGENRSFASFVATQYEII